MTEANKAPEPMAEPAKTAPKPRAEFRHPVLSMMGISRLRIPSRNWLIFWGITGTLVGGYYWDRRERIKVRDYWVEKVAYLGQQPITPYDVPRKLTVYVAPPPNDFIDAGLQHFRNFIKPVFTSAAVDHELITEERQGFIRSQVAQKIRKLRKSLKLKDEPQDEPQDKLEAKIDSKWIRDMTGGTVLIGRGAYKEYMSGLQEGWFGPLERPQFVQDLIDKQDEEERERLLTRKRENAKSTDGAREVDYLNEEDYEQDRKASLNRKFPVEPAYIRTKDLADLDLPTEFAQHVPDPLSVVRHPHLLGILMAPVRIYRWLNQKYLAEEMGRQAAGIVFAQTRQYELEDANLAVSDEDDWPNRFKSNGMDNDSEWMREFHVDPRFAAALRVYTEAERAERAERVERAGAKQDGRETSDASSK